MTDCYTKWKEDGQQFGWTMPMAARWKRLPVIRHIRAYWIGFKVEWWYAFGPGGAFGIRTGYDNWVVYGILMGEERDP